MKKILNSPAQYVDEMLEGLTVANKDLELSKENLRVVRALTGDSARKVGVVSGGGSGHLPLFTGYVGWGLLDSCSIGNVFEGPNAQSCLDAIKAGDRGHGVLCLYGNYGGDRMNFDMACEMASLEGIETTTILGTDDIASAGKDEIDKRRGVAGLIFAYKAAGAAADQGGDLNAVSEAAQRAVDRTRTLGFALSSCQVPSSSEPTFSIAKDEMEMGMGIHGEPGIWRDKLKLADDIVDEMMQRLLSEAPHDAGKDVAVLVNSLGATPLEELFILYRRIREVLDKKGFNIAYPLVGHFATSMEMAGASISISFLTDELLELYKAPARSPFWQVS